MIPSAVRTGHPTCIRRGNRYFTRLSANFYNLILRQAYNSFESDQNSSPKNVLSGQRLGLPPLMIYSHYPVLLRHPLRLATPQIRSSKMSNNGESRST